MWQKIAYVAHVSHLINFHVAFFLMHEQSCIVTGAFEVANAAGLLERQYVGGGASSGGWFFAATAPSSASPSAAPSAATASSWHWVQPDSISRTKRDTRWDRKLQPQAQALTISGEFLWMKYSANTFSVCHVRNDSRCNFAYFLAECLKTLSKLLVSPQFELWSANITAAL